MKQVKSVRERLLQSPPYRGGMDKVRDRRESELLASHSAPWIRGLFDESGNIGASGLE